jgi:hypothetical protein
MGVHVPATRRSRQKRFSLAMRPAGVRKAQGHRWRVCESVETAVGLDPGKRQLRQFEPACASEKRRGAGESQPSRPFSPCCMRRLRAARSWPSSPYPALVLPLCVLASLHIPSLPSRLRRRCDPVASVLALASRPRSPGDPVGDLQPIPSLRQVSLFPGSLPPSQYIPLEPAQPADTRPQTHTLSKQARTMGFFEKLQASMFFPARPAWRTRPAPTGTPWLTGTARTRALPP